MHQLYQPCQISDLSEIVAVLGDEICRNVKALYLQNNPVVSSVTLDHIFTVFPNLEIYNTKLTSKYTEWSILFLLDTDETQGIRSIDLSDRGLPVWKPEVFEKFVDCNVINVRETEMSGDCQDLFETVSRMPKLSEILVDFVVHQLIYDRLEDNADNMKRCARYLSKINGWLLSSPKPTIEQLNAALIHQKIWQYLDWYHYSFMNVPNWYLMDQLGISINHSDDPNMRMATIYFIDAQQAFNVMWPIKDIEIHHPITRDFLFGVSPQEKREALMSIWNGIPLYYRGMLNQLDDDGNDDGNNVEKNKLYEVKPIRYDDTITKKESKRSFTYYTDSQMVIDSLALQSKDDTVQFKLIDSQDKADILFIVHEHVRSYKTIAKRKQFVNQFEEEENYTMKGKLSQSIRSFKFPFIPETYDLSIDAHQINEFLQSWHRKKLNNEDNVWIVKPWNLSRSMNMTVSDDYTALLKASLPGPKICSKYVSNPCLLDGKKFDFRFLVMVKPVSSTDISVAVHNSYYIRIGNHKYSLNDFQDFQKHFTVMNYYEDPVTGEKHQVARISQQESLKMFENEHGEWKPVETKIFDALRQLFISMKKFLLVNDQSAYQRSVYGVDVMLDHDLTPKILEVNFSPDVGRLVRYGEYPTFYIDAFKFLFTNEQVPAGVTLLV